MSKKKENQNIEDADIKMTPTQVEDDTDMPQPETKNYQKMLQLTDKFMQLLDQSLGTLPWNTILTNADGNKIRIIDLVRFAEAHQKSIPVNEVNTLVSYIANLDFKHARPIMEIVENKDLQPQLWLLADEN